MDNIINIETNDVIEKKEELRIIELAGISEKKIS